MGGQQSRMPLQNRVSPHGDVIAVAARGALMGNRGRLHDATLQIVRRQVSSYRAWVTCLLAFKGRRRTVMAPGRYTELFFLDEATALAAGHRPCGECRRADYRRFKASWLAGNPERDLPGAVPIAAIDCELHRDRLTSEGLQRTFQADLASLPDGLRRFAPFEGGATDNGGFHPRLASVPDDEQLLFGIHVDKVPLAFHLTYHRFPDAEHFSEATGGEALTG